MIKTKTGQCKLLFITNDKGLGGLTKKWIDKVIYIRRLTETGMEKVWNF